MDVSWFANCYNRSHFILECINMQSKKKIYAEIKRDAFCLCAEEKRWFSWLQGNRVKLKTHFMYSQNRNQLLWCDHCVYYCRNEIKSRGQKLSRFTLLKQIFGCNVNVSVLCAHISLSLQFSGSNRFLCHLIWIFKNHHKFRHHIEWSHFPRISMFTFVHHLFMDVVVKKTTYKLKFV